MADDRKRYWNEHYVRYWRDRTTAGEGKQRQDCTPADVSLFEKYLGLLGLVPGERVLEVGVGFGRLLPSLLQCGVVVYGVDISPQMIDEAVRLHGQHVAELREGEAESLAYMDQTFDHIICWGVFDACDQTTALAEMARVLRIGGTLLLSGKNDDYDDDDELAYVAEVNERKKGHPNFFTCMPLLIQAAEADGLVRERTFFFRKRGDLSSDVYVTAAPPRFYEYAIVFRKARHVGVKPALSIAAPVSRTYARRQSQERA